MLRRRGRMASSVSNPSLRRALLILPVWIFCVAWLWSWWLPYGHSAYLLLFIPLTLAMFYEFTVLPSAFLYFVIKAKKPPRRTVMKNKKVALISLCVPKLESIDIIEKQLKAMSEVAYPHDSWILDEGGSKQVKLLARKYKVKYFTRKGISKYNQPAPPFKRKTKAGNVNAWLEHVKRRKYDFFVQLDIDHIPKPNYLNKTLGFFRDPKVAWVQAPSVYSNLGNWVARGSAEQELVLQGPLQMGFYGYSKTPFIIGSHCTYRMSAIREIGGFQPTRAEDHLDTLYLSHKGYEGIFLPEIIAEGDGPETLSTYLAQQYAWAFSMFQVLISHTPSVLKEMPWKKKLQFLFAQTWYPVWSLSYLVLFMCPIIALWLNRDVVSVDGNQMLVHFLPLFICSFLIWLSARPLMQPKKLFISWRGIILHAVRWPIIIKAILAAIFKVTKPYMITPKGKFARAAPSVKTYRPFLFFGSISAMSVIMNILANNGSRPEAQLVFALSNTGFMLSICAIDLALRFHQFRPKKKEFNQYWFKPIIATSALAGLLLISGLVLLFSTSVRADHLTQANNSSDSVSVNISQPADYSMSTEQLINQIRLVPASTNEVPKVGIYNDTFNVPKASQPYIQHTFADWRDDHYLAFSVLKTLQAGNTPLITIEPRGEKNGEKLLGGIEEGRYDDLIKRMAKVTSASNNTIYIRFAHEMELAKLYPWGNQKPSQYIAAFRHTEYIFKENNTKNVRMVWSPAGNIGASAYYPGDSFVDVIGVTVLYDKYWYGSHVPSFLRVSSNRAWLKSFNKPLWIVEFGAGASSYSIQKDLIKDSLDNYSRYGFSALVYLNIRDANLVGPDYRLKSINDFANLFSVDKDKQEQDASPKPEEKKAHSQQERGNYPTIDVENKCAIDAFNLAIYLCKY